jgi:hypothetical protein
MRSACYRQSNDGLDCLNCHMPHVTVYHEERPADLFRRACLRCHALDDCSASSEIRDATSPADDCVACHMPRGEPSDQPSTRYTDHWIRRPGTPAETTGSWELEWVPLVEPESWRPGEQAFYRGRGLARLAAAAADGERGALLVAAEAELARAVAAGFEPETSNRTQPRPSGDGDGR